MPPMPFFAHTHAECDTRLRFTQAFTKPNALLSSLFSTQMTDK
jgi:hypothetical protein